MAIVNREDSITGTDAMLQDEAQGMRPTAGLPGWRLVQLYSGAAACACQRG